MTVFYLIRHAHAHWTPDEQRPLSTRGRRDARRVAAVLCIFPVTRIVSSPFPRATQTVGPLAQRLRLPVDIEPDLRERKLGLGPSVDDFLAAVERTWLDPTYAHPGGESNVAAQRRGVAVVERLRERHPGQHIVISTHGNLMALVLQHYDPRVDHGFWKALTMPDIHSLQMTGDQVSIDRLWERKG